jgi:hypothetical protein
MHVYAWRWWTKLTFLAKNASFGQIVHIWSKKLSFAPKHHTAKTLIVKFCPKKYLTKSKTFGQIFPYFANCLFFDQMLF